MAKLIFEILFVPDIWAVQSVVERAKSGRSRGGVSVVMGMLGLAQSGLGDYWWFLMSNCELFHIIVRRGRKKYLYFC